MQHFTIKPGVPLAEQAELGHNRWHPDIPFLSTVKPGEEIIIESLDFLDAQADYRSVQVTYLNLVASYLTAASQLNLSVGREVIQ